MNQAQSLPFGVGGGLVAIKTLLSRDPCAHANTAIQMIDAILAEHPAHPQQELEYCTDYHCAGDCGQPHNQKEMREFLALQPQQEPVAWVCYGAPGKRDIDFEEADINGLPIGTLLYTSPPARKPLTDEQVLDCWKQAYDPGRREHDNATRMARAIEAAHGIKGDA